MKSRNVIVFDKVLDWKVETHAGNVVFLNIVSCGTAKNMFTPAYMDLTQIEAITEGR
jgi:hypothetical protein